MYCKDCKHREFHDGLESPICTNYAKIDEDKGQDKRDDMLIYSYAESGLFHVGDKFGCVHFEQKVSNDSITSS